MMNAFALNLVLTSLLTSGFFSPNPEKVKSKEDVIVKDGGRVVVVEYEKDDGHTKVSISPPESFDHRGFAGAAKDKLSEKMEDVKEGTKELASNAKEKLSEKMKDVKEKVSEKMEDGKESAADMKRKVSEKMEEEMEKVKGSVAETKEKLSEKMEEGVHSRFRPKELVCDAYGKCKHKIAAAIGKTSEKVEEAAAEGVNAAIGKAKDAISEPAHKVFDKMKQAKENVSEIASGIKEEASRTMDAASETAKERAGDAVDRAKKLKKEGKKELSEIIHHAREVVSEVLHYIISRETAAAVTGTAHLMGFAAVYGMCVWVTFASSHVLANALPRQQFAMVQSKIYPLYFKGMGCGVGLAYLAHLMSPKKTYWGFDLAAALAAVLVNLIFLEPRATKVMFERMKKEKEEGNGKEVEPGAGRGSTGLTRDEAKNKSEMRELSVSMRRLNSYSSFLNVATLVCLTWHLARVGPRLHAVC